MNPCFLQELDLIIINFEICLKGLCHAIWYLFEKLRRISVVSIQSHFDTKSFRYKSFRYELNFDNSKYMV